jgi:hypothetical protein
MKVSMKYWRRSIVFVVVIMSLIMSTPVLASNSNPGVFPPNSHPYGQTYGEWNAKWWQWMFSVPASKNPEVATNGLVDCSVGQSGSVWFLAGSFSSGSFSRRCTVPVGKALVIPIHNSWADNVCSDPQLSVDELRALAADPVIPPEQLHASIDGNSLTNLESYRAISPEFSYTLPPSPDNVISAVFGVSLPGSCWPSLTVSPAVADGFYIVLPPLSQGLHRINFGSPLSSGTLDITYDITVS